MPNANPATPRPGVIPIIVRQKKGLRNDRDRMAREGIGPHHDLAAQTR